MGALSLVVVLAACGEATDRRSAPGPSSSPTQMGTPAGTSSSGVVLLRDADSGRTIHLPSGGMATIMLGQGIMAWSEPVVTGTAVTVIEQVSDAATEARTWDVTAVEAGTAQVQLTGSPICRGATPPCAAPDGVWAVDFSVTR